MTVAFFLRQRAELPQITGTSRDLPSNTTISQGIFERAA
jgi:hypothetical protein